VNLRELWRLSTTVFKELSFQSIFSLRAGSALPRRGKTDINQLVKTAQFNTLISKILTTVFICIFGLTVFVPLMGRVHPSDPRGELAVAGSISAFLASVLFLIVFMGLQVSTSIVSSKIADVLSPLPLMKKDVSNIIFICFMRIFDLPLIASIAVLLAFYFFVGGSLLGGLISFVAIIVTEVFALALTIGLARFFFSKVAGGGGRSIWKTFLRFASMLVWILPTFAAYIVVSYAQNIVETFAALTLGLSSNLQLLVLIYPFSFGFLVSSATFFHETSYVALGLSITASLAYVALAVYSFRWVASTMRKIGGQGIGSTVRELVKDTLIKPQVPWLGIVRKDLRIASRSPSYASLYLLPALQTTVLAISFSSFSEAGFSVALGILTGVSMMTLLLPPTMFSIEGLASAYIRSLPLKKKTLIFAKTALSTFTYAISLAALFLVALFLGRDFTYILAYGIVHALSVAAASMLELVILANKFWKEGFALGNVYARLSTFILIMLPGLAIAFIPIIVAFATFFLAETLTLPVFLITAFIEFAIMAFVAFHEN
jgi:hypothetical protein